MGQAVELSYRPLNGSVIGFVAWDWQSNLINLVTGGIPGRSIHHVGIYCDGLIYESTQGGRPPCAVTGKDTCGVQAHSLETIRGIACYSQLWEYPLRRRLYDAEKLRLRQFCDSQLGKEYDLIGATRSGGKVYAAIWSFLWGENVNKFFCSEFVAAALAEVGVLQIDNVSRVSPNRLLRRLRKTGICQKPLRLK